MHHFLIVHLLGWISALLVGVVWLAGTAANTVSRDVGQLIAKFPIEVELGVVNVRDISRIENWDDGKAVYEDPTKGSLWV